ncbi:MAG: hypothetical protein ACJAWT_002014 [Glaciecola sp.]|jgi:hypothetical protein
MQLIEFSNKQDVKTNVNEGILLVTLIPVIVLSGDYESEVSRWKGEVQSVETAQMKKSCKS